MSVGHEGPDVSHELEAIPLSLVDICGACTAQPPAFKCCKELCKLRVTPGRFARRPAKVLGPGLINRVRVLPPLLVHLVVVRLRSSGWLVEGL